MRIAIFLEQFDKCLSQYIRAWIKKATAPTTPEMKLDGGLIEVTSTVEAYPKFTIIREIFSNVRVLLPGPFQLHQCENG